MTITTALDSPFCCRFQEQCRHSHHLQNSCGTLLCGGSLKVYEAQLLFWSGKKKVIYKLKFISSSWKLQVTNQGFLFTKSLKISLTRIQYINQQLSKYFLMGPGEISYSWQMSKGHLITLVSEHWSWPFNKQGPQILGSNKWHRWRHWTMLTGSRPLWVLTMP